MIHHCAKLHSEKYVNNEPWFVGKDVAESLGYKNASKALADHVEECDKLNNESLSSLGQRGGWLINESGLYALIFGSKLESAKRFKHWVTNPKNVVPKYVHNDDKLSIQIEYSGQRRMVTVISASGLKFFVNKVSRFQNEST